jgi:hypothetical protein
MPGFDLEFSSDIDNNAVSVICRDLAEAVRRTAPVTGGFFPMSEPAGLDINSWEVERRDDGAVVVRVRSRQVDGEPLPDAIFAFRAGEPQYHYWQQILLDRETSAL